MESKRTGIDAARSTPANTQNPVSRPVSPVSPVSAVEPTPLRHLTCPASDKIYSDNRGNNRTVEATARAGEQRKIPSTLCFDNTTTVTANLPHKEDQHHTPCTDAMEPPGSSSAASLEAESALCKDPWDEMFKIIKPGEQIEIPSSLCFDNTMEEMLHLPLNPMYRFYGIT